MNYFSVNSDGENIIVTIDWWVPVASIICISVSIFFFRLIAICGVSGLWSRLGTGRLGLKATGLILMPALVVMLVSGITLWASLVYKFQVNDEGISERHILKHFRHGSWNKLWSFHQTDRYLFLEFFRQDEFLVTKRESNDGFPNISRIIVEKTNSLDIQAQQRRLLEETGIRTVNPRRDE
jgi:hypothetical protein